MTGDGLLLLYKHEYLLGQETWSYCLKRGMFAEKNNQEKGSCQGTWRYNQQPSFGISPAKSMGYMVHVNQ